jgi:arylsulfatase A-like enzyme
MRRQQPGMSDVTAELSDAMPTLGTAAGVPEDAYKRFLESTDKVEQVRKYRLGLEKLAEVLAESEAHYEDQREHALSQIVDAVKSTAKRNKNKGIRAPFEKSIRYTQQATEKAVKTRKKNAAEKAARKPAAT